MSVGKFDIPNMKFLKYEGKAVNIKDLKRTSLYQQCFRELCTLLVRDIHGDLAAVSTSNSYLFASY